MWSCKGSMNEHVWIMLTLPPCRGHPSSGRKPPSNQDRHWGNIYCIESKAWRTNHIPEHLVRLRVICRCIRCSQTAMGILLYQKFVHLCKTVLGASLVQVTHVFVHARYVIIFKKIHIFIYIIHVPIDFKDPFHFEDCPRTDMPHCLHSRAASQWGSQSCHCRDWHLTRAHQILYCYAHKVKKKCPCFSFWTWGFPTCDDSGDNFLQHLDLLPPRQKWVHSTNWCGICSSGHACTDTQENINMQFMIFQVSCWKQLGMQASSHGRTTNERQLQ